MSESEQDAASDDPDRPRAAGPACGGAPRATRGEQSPLPIPVPSSRAGTGRPADPVDPRDMMLQHTVSPSWSPSSFLLSAAVSTYFVVRGRIARAGDGARLGERGPTIPASASGARRCRRRVGGYDGRRRIRRLAASASGFTGGFDGGGFDGGEASDLGWSGPPHANTALDVGRPRLRWTGADHSIRTTLRGHQRILSRRATSRRRSPSSPRASTRVRPTSCCSARPAPASPRPRRGSSSRCSARRSCSRTTRRSPRSWPTSSATSCRTTPSSTSSATTTTTSPRRTSRRPTPSSRRTRRSTPRSSGCVTPRRTRC